MSSPYPFLLSGQPGLSVLPALTDTIHVTSSYTVAAGDSLDFAGSPGFKLEVRHDALVTLDIDGAVNLDGGKHLKVTGILTSRSIHGDAQVAIGSTGSLTVATEAVGGLAVGALMQSEGSSFVNEGLVQVSSVNGAATGVSATGASNIAVANTDTIQVQAATTAFGVAVVTSGSVSNSGSISAAGARALGMALASGISHTATMVNTGQVEAVGSADSGWAYGAELVGGDFTNTGRIHAASAGDAFGAHVSDLDSLTNTGHIVAASTGVGGHSIGLLVDTTFNGGTIANSGVVRGEYALAGDDAGRAILGGVGVASNDVVINTGKLVGDVALGGGSDGLSNTGRMVGDVDLGDGGDILITNRGRLTGDIMGGLGNDYLMASGGNDTVYGDEQDDSLGGGDDALRGMKGSDLLFGGQGVDTLLGGLGADTLSGGAGDDVFTLAKLADSTAAAPDLITDLASTETIDLQRIDADTTVGGDQAFHLVASFSGAAGELTVAYDGASGLTTISGDVDGDGSADLVITAAGDHSGFSGFVL